MIGNDDDDDIDRETMTFQYYLMKRHQTEQQKAHLPILVLLLLAAN